MESCRYLQRGRCYQIFVLEQSFIAHRSAEFEIEAIPLSDDYLVESMLYSVEKGLSQEMSMSLVINYSEKLKGCMHTLKRIMAIELLKIFLMAQMAKGIPPDRVKNRGIKI